MRQRGEGRSTSHGTHNRLEAVGWEKVGRQRNRTNGLVVVLRVLGWLLEVVGMLRVGEVVNVDVVLEVHDLLQGVAELLLPISVLA